MKARKGTRQEGGCSPLRYVDNEEGMMLVLTMVIFLVLTSLAATNIINSYLERSLARNHHYATVSLNAADAGIDHGLGWLNANAPDDHTVNPGWVMDDPDGDGNNDVDGGWDLNGNGNNDVLYDVTMNFKLDEDDLDNDGDTTDIVLYNRCTWDEPTTPPDPPPPHDDCFGFPGAVFGLATKTAAYPVVQIRSEGAYVGDEGTGPKTPSDGAGRRVVTLDVARNGFEIKAYGAVTAASNVNVTGNINVDGSAHDETGALCSVTGGCTCGDEFPGVTTEDGYTVSESGSSNNNGVPDASSDISTLSTNLGVALSVPNSPDDALGLPEGSLVDSLPGGTISPGEVKTFGNVTYSAGDYTWNLNGTDTGILVVHNPMFDAEAWAVSDCRPPPDRGPQCNSAHAKYDPQLDPGVSGFPLDTSPGSYAGDRSPAVLDQHGNGTWKGAVIADKIDKINGNCNVIGAMISLTTVATNILGNGAANILYSCDAINLYTTQGYSTKLAWRRMFN